MDHKYKVKNDILYYFEELYENWKEDYTFFCKCGCYGINYQEVLI